MKRIHSDRFSDTEVFSFYLALGQMCSYGECYIMSDEEGTAADTPEKIFCQITLKS